MNVHGVFHDVRRVAVSAPVTAVMVLGSRPAGGESLLDVGGLYEFRNRSSWVRQLRHHFGPSFRDIWALYHPTHAVHCALLGYHAYWMLSGACDPML